MLFNLSTKFWTITGVIIGVAGLAGLAYTILKPEILPDKQAAVASPAKLTGEIHVFPYKHASSSYSVLVEEDREQYKEPFKEKLKKETLPEHVQKTVIKVLDEVFKDKYFKETSSYPDLPKQLKAMYSITIKNEGVIPLRRVFLRVPKATYWVNPKGRLEHFNQRLDVGDMDQASEKHFTLWGHSLNEYFLSKDKIVLGHAEGIGQITFK